MSQVDVLIQHSAQSVTASALWQRQHAATGTTRAEALDALTALLEAEVILGRVRSTWGPPPRLRLLRPVVPATHHGRLLELELHLVAAFLPQEGDDEGLSWVIVPQLGATFEAQDTANATAIAAEVLREGRALDDRLEHLLPYTRPLSLTRARAADEDWLELERVRVRGSQRLSSAARETIQTPTLTATGEPLHRLMQDRDAPRAFERDAEVDLLLDYLSAGAQRAALLVGPSGVGKTAIAREVARRMVRREAPAALSGAPVWSLTGARILAGARGAGAWQQRVLSIIDEALATRAVLFIEDLVALLDATGAEEIERGITGLLLPRILSGELPLIAELRPEQLARVEQTHPSLLRALRRVPVEPMRAPQTDATLERESFRMGRTTGVRLSVNARQKIIELTTRFDTAALPGAAVTLARRAATTHGGQATTAPHERLPELHPSQITAAYASQTGMPAALLDASMQFNIQDVRDRFTREILAQPEATDALTDLVVVLRAGLNDPRRPLATLLLIGPTGVGKTQSARSLASYLFGDEDRLLRLDMSEYQGADAAARLVGRARGEDGHLTRRLREQPFQVVLLDELEKADPSVFDLMLQVFGEGRLTDGFGQTLNLKNAVFVMTSNLGAGGPSTLGFGAADGEAHQRASAAHYRSAVSAFFRPELVGRIDRIIPFRPLGPTTARQLVQRALDEIPQRPGLARRNLRLDISPQVIDHLATLGFDPRYGARPLRQTVEREVTARVAAHVIADPSLHDAVLRLRWEGGVRIAPQSPPLRAPLAPGDLG